MIGKMCMLFTVKEGCQGCDSAFVFDLLKKWSDISAAIIERLETEIPSNEFLMWNIELDQQRGEFFLACRVFLCSTANINCPGTPDIIKGYQVKKSFGEEVYIQDNVFQVSFSYTGPGSYQIKAQELIDWIVKELS